MIPPGPYAMSVNPTGMLWVAIRSTGGDETISAISVKYIPVTVKFSNGLKSVVAIELLHDPANPNPTGPYHCNPAMLERRVLPPQAVASIRPFLAQQPSLAG